MRPLIAVLGALLINALLFLLMEKMVAGEAVDSDRAKPDRLAIDFVRLKEESEPPPPDPLDKLEEPPPDETPPVPDSPKLATNKPDAPAPSWEMPAIELPLNLGNGPYLAGFRFVEPEMPAEPVPLVRISPQYPQRALMRRIEGTVQVAFTIAVDGTVTDPEVVKADPRGYFEQAALRAIRHWKFQPEKEDGIAVARRATQTIRFALKNP